MLRRALPALLLTSLAVPACGKEEGPQVAFLLSTLQDERSRKDVRHFENHAKALGLRVITFAADNESAKQSAQVEDALAQGARILVIQPTDGQLSSSYVRLAHEKGAKVIAYGRPIVASDLDYYVSHDSHRVGVLQAEAALRATGDGTARTRNFVVLAGPAGHSAAGEITRGYKDTLAPYIARGDIDVVVEQYHSASSPEQALRTVEDALARTNNQVDAILAHNSGMARGAVQAIQAKGLTNVFIAGAGADAANVNLVCQGKQTIDVLEDVQPLAKAAADVAKQLLDGERIEAGSSIVLAGTSIPVAAVRVDLVTPDTVKSLVVDTGYLSADELPACKSRLARR